MPQKPAVALPETKNRFAGGAVFLLVALYFLSGNVSATLIDRGTSTVDTNTNLEWLDVTESTSYTYNQILADEGGVISGGWRYAIEAEIDVLFYTYTGLPEEVRGYSGPVLELIDLLGYTYYRTLTPSYYIYKIYGLFDDALTNPFDLMVGRANIESNPSVGYWATSGDSTAYHQGSSSVGSFLVRNAATIPEPPPLILLAPAVIGFAALRRRNTVFGRPQRHHRFISRNPRVRRVGYLHSDRARLGRPGFA